MPHPDTWYSRVQKMKQILGVSNLNGCKDSVGKFLGEKLNSTFDRFELDQIKVRHVTNIKNNSQPHGLPDLGSALCPTSELNPANI